MTLKATDRGFDALLGRLRELDKGTRITVGVHPDVGANAHPSGGRIGEVARVVELGTADRAPVGFLRTTIDGKLSALGRELAAAGADALRTGKSPREAFTGIASRVAAEVRAKVPVKTGTLQRSVEARVNGAVVG